MPHPQS